jgi:hypothetical protein
VQMECSPRARSSFGAPRNSAASATLALEYPKVPPARPNRPVQTCRAAGRLDVWERSASLRSGPAPTKGISEQDRRTPSRRGRGGVV